jgi:hypothetical protein
MRKLDTLQMHPLQQSIVEILSIKTQNTDTMFFHLMVAYHFSKLATMMRTNVSIDGLGVLPVNMYAINLAPSGSGKGRSMNIIEDQVINRFRERFMEETFFAVSNENLAKLSLRRANNKHSTPEIEKQLLEDEFNGAGPMVFSFDSATTAAVKQMRHKLLLANIGSMNMEIDEIGSNMLGNMEVLTSFLELFDIGKIKQKLTKHTKENNRSEELYGSTPTNMLLFGTPTKLLNGSKVEDEFYEMLEVGYARRCFFGFSKYRKHEKPMTPQEIYSIFTDPNNENTLFAIADKLAELADIVNYGSTIKMPKDVMLELISYRQHCDHKAESYSEYEEIRKAELKHRYFKAAKLAGTYAFIDQSVNITEDHLYHAIAMTEASGRAFDQILRRERPYAKLASYICTIKREVTHADLVEDLPFYKGTEAQKRDMLSLAVAYGYKNNLIIKRETIDGIEFLSGNSLPVTDLNKLKLSYSNDFTKNYDNRNGHWDNLVNLCTREGYHWCNHHFMEHEDFPSQRGYRDEAHTYPGFNLLVLDVENSVSMDLAKSLLFSFTWFMHTTKRHTPDNHRFRIVLPMSHVLELDQKDYREFMNNIYDWLPFTVDRQTNQRSRKWETSPGTHFYNAGHLLDVLQFIPKTKKAEENKVKLLEQASLNNLERWFLNQMEEGNRNNMLLRYAFCLVDQKMSFDDIKAEVLALNSQSKNPLAKDEVLNTIMVSVAKKLQSN